MSALSKRSERKLWLIRRDKAVFAECEDLLAKLRVLASERRLIQEELGEIEEVERLYSANTEEVLLDGQ